MVSVMIGSNLKRKRYSFDPDTTIRAAIEQTAAETGIDPAVTMMTMDGSPLNPGEMNKTFAQFGYTGEVGHDSCTLISVAKLANA